MQYNPWDHVEELGVSVGWHPLARSNGIWIPSKRRIILGTHLPEWAVAPILAHEAVHAEYNDPPGYHEPTERRCDRIAARRLIDPEVLGYLTKTTPNYDEICIELGVTRPMLVEYARSESRESAYP